MSIDIATIAYSKTKKYFSRNSSDNEKKDIKKEVSVLIPAFNEGNRLYSTVESILKQTYPVKEIYILDDLSTDNTPYVCKDLEWCYDNVRHVRRDRKLGKAGNINAIVREKSKELGESIFVVDGDVSLEHDCLENLVKKSDGAAIVTGFGYTKEPDSYLAKMIYEGESWINSVFGFRKRAQSMRNSISVICGALSMYDKKTLKEIPIPERTLTEDTDYTWLILENKKKVAYAEKARAQGGNPNSLKGYWKRYNRWFSGTFQNLYLHGYKELKKSPGLCWTTITPGLLETVPYSIAIASIPITAFIAPDLAKGILAADFALSVPFLFMHQKGFWHAVNHLPDIYAYKYFGSLSCLYAGFKTTSEKIMGKEYKWKNHWESSSEEKKSK